MRNLVLFILAVLSVSGIAYGEKYFIESDSDGNIMSTYIAQEACEVPSKRAVTEVTLQKYDKVLAKGKEQGWKDLKLEDLIPDGVITPQEIAEKKNEAKNKKTKDEQIKDLTQRIEALEKK